LTKMPSRNGSWCVHLPAIPIYTYEQLNGRCIGHPHRVYEYGGQDEDFSFIDGLTHKPLPVIIDCTDRYVDTAPQLHPGAPEQNECVEMLTTSNKYVKDENHLIIDWTERTVQGKGTLDEFMDREDVIRYDRRRKRKHHSSVNQYLDTTRNMVAKKVVNNEKVELHPCWLCTTTTRDRRNLRVHIKTKHKLDMSYFDMAKTALKAENGRVVRDNAWEDKNYIYNIHRIKCIGLLKQYFMGMEDLRKPWYKHGNDTAEGMEWKEQLASRMASLFRVTYTMGITKTYHNHMQELRISALGELGRYGLVKISENYIAYITMKGKQVVDRIIRTYIESGKEEITI